MDTVLPPTTRRRLHRHARQALAAYALPPVRLTLHSALDDAVFRVSVPSGQGRPLPEHYVLRLHSATPAVAVESELLWLRALRDEAGLDVPAPYRTRDGALVTLVAESEGHPAVLWSMRQWMPGRRLTRVTPARLTQVGRFMAALHTHAAAYQPPPGFLRAPWDWERFFGLSSLLNPVVTRDRLSTDDLATFTAFAIHTREVFAAIGTGRESLGVIHSDLHQSNYLFYKGRVQAIDFTDCGIGPYLFDMAVCLSEAEDPNGEGATPPPALRAAFLEGYSRVRALPPFYTQHISTFLGLRLVDLVNWALSWPALTARPWGPRFLPFAARQLRLYLDS